MFFTKNKRKNSYAFTLVELIVVITILVILGTIAFVSLTGYSGSARDSARVSDVTNLSKSLDIAYIKTSTYPNPDNAFSVTYSGGVLWNQGVIGDSVMNIFSAAGAKLSKKLTDPLNITKEYTYSRVAYGNAYQIKADYEADSVAQYVPKFADNAFAASGNPALTYIKGNYNGIAVKTQTGGVVYLVATPSIITSQSGAIGSGYEIISALPNKILFHGQTNSGGVIFTPKLIFASGSLPSSDAEKTLFATGIIEAYSGTSLSTQSNIQSFVAAAADTSTLVSLGGGLLSTGLGGGTSSAAPVTPQGPTSLCGSSKNQTVGYPSTVAFQSNLCSASGSVLSWTGIGGTTGSDTLSWTCKDALDNTENCTANYAKFSQNSVICNTSDILIGSLTGSYQVWAACNVGASLASTASGIVGADGNQTLLGANEINAVGYYFQWHRNDILAMDPSDGALASTLTGTRSTVNQSSFTASAPAGIANLFIRASGSWRLTGSTTDSSWGQGPCQAGYHVPTGGTSTTSTEWGNAFVIMGTNYSALRNALQLPYSGSRANATGAFGGQGINAWYGSASPFSVVGSYASLVYLSDVFPDISGNNTRSLGVSVRCIRD